VFSIASPYKDPFCNYVTIYHNKYYTQKQAAKKNMFKLTKLYVISKNFEIRCKMSIKQLQAKIGYYKVRLAKEQYQKEFDEKIDELNVYRAKLTSLFFVVIEILVLLFTLILRKNDLFRAPELYYVLMYFGMLVVMLAFFSLFSILQKNIADHRAAIQIAGISFSSFILVWCAGISFLDQLHSGQIMVYIVAVIAVSVTPVFKPRILTLMYLPIHISFLLLLIYSQKSTEIPFGNIVNSTTFVIISWAIAYMRYNRQVAAFNNNKLIEEKNIELEKINKKLQEANEKLEILSQTDGLTGILNRTMFDRTISLEWDRCKRQFTPLSLIMGDIDCFKSFNDNYGHQAGDNCIRQVAAVLSSCARRASDSVARYGGEEFAVILPDINKNDAEKLAELMRKRVEELSIPHSASCESEFVTISMGVYTVTPSNELTLEELIGNADKSLYEAKQWRNKVVVFDQTEKKAAQ
jgi:diguanylate cyclase (GGDEF)-like protein